MQVLSQGLATTLNAQVVSPFLAADVLASVTFDVIDADGVIVQGTTSATITDAATGSVSLGITAPATTLIAGVISGIRKVRLTALYSGGKSNPADFNFVVRLDAALQTGVNSFCTSLEAELIAFELPSVAGWDAVGLNSTGDVQKTNAMVSARADLLRLTYRYGRSDSQSYLTPAPNVGSGLSELTVSQYLGLPVLFRNALSKAQVIQADYILGGGTEEERLSDAGVLSKKVGEASATFRLGVGPVRYPVCSQAMAALYGFLEMNQWQIARG